MTNPTQHVFASLSDEEATKLSKLSRAKLVQQIDELRSENQELKSQTIPVMLQTVREEATLLSRDIGWVFVRLVESLALVSKAYQDYMAKRQFDLFSVEEAQPDIAVDFKY